MHLLSHLAPLVATAAPEVAAHAEKIAPTHVEPVGWLFLIPLFPLIGAFLNAALGKPLQTRLGKAANHAIAIGAMVAAFAVGIAAFVKMLGLGPEERTLRDFVWNMWTAGQLQVSFSLVLDPLSMMMVLVITGIGTLIHVYSTGYMAGEEAYWRFFSYLNLFVFSMLLLVMGDNFALMFFGWEGVGLCSYLLIGFWYTDLDKAKAAMKAFVVNRFGDFGFLIGLWVLFWGLGGSWMHSATAQTDAYVPAPAYTAVAQPTVFEQGSRLPTLINPHDAKEQVRVGPTLDFRELKDQMNLEWTGVRKHLDGQTFWGMPLLFMVCLFFFVGAAGKSAQIPLYVWLPDAMAGPTPVSALIHAATMVTAGIYMIARLNFLFSLSPGAMTVVAVIGTLTAFFAATVGFFQYDIKKVLAYSTISQLGFMFIGVGVGAYWAGVYHLLTHAFFKACLFLGSGSVILGCHHEQDMRKMGGLKRLMPTTAKTYLYACIAISGFPIANGFFSKDVILGSAFAAGDNLVLVPGWLLWLVGWIAAAGTSYYMWRSYYMTFSGEYRGGGGHHEAHAAPALAVATHSLGAAHSATFHQDAKSSAVHAVHGHGAHDADPHGHHGGAPRESPRAMTWVLVTLAVGIGVTVLLGLDDFAHVLTGGGLLSGLSLERWLEPVITSAPLVQSRRHELEKGLELALMGASVGVAFLGWGAAKWLYDGNRQEARLLALKGRYEGFWTVIFNKYYVDELYGATVVRGSMVASAALAWFDAHVLDFLVVSTSYVIRFVANIDGAIDKYLVDGAVNAVAEGVIAAGTSMRRLQTGRIQLYLYGALAGALVFVGINYVIR